MKRIGFGDKWIKLIMLCMKTVSFSIMVNGESKGLVFPTYVLRQGDLISPYLFMLCTEDLIALLQQVQVYKQIDGIQICKRAPKINYLLFVDNNILFCSSTLQDQFKSTIPAGNLPLVRR